MGTSPCTTCTRHSAAPKRRQSPGLASNPPRASSPVKWSPNRSALTGGLAVFTRTMDWGTFRLHMLEPHCTIAQRQRFASFFWKSDFPQNDHLETYFTRRLISCDCRVGVAASRSRARRKQLASWRWRRCCPLMPKPEPVRRRQTMMTSNRKLRPSENRIETFCSSQIDPPV